MNKIRSVRDTHRGDALFQLLTQQNVAYRLLFCAGCVYTLAIKTMYCPTKSTPVALLHATLHCRDRRDRRRYRRPLVYIAHEIANFIVTSHVTIFRRTICRAAHRSVVIHRRTGLV